MDPVLSLRALNRASMERQLLLRRTDLSVLEVVEHLFGLQAQTPHTWYAGLWNRIEGFDPLAASALLDDRELVRIAMQRSTIHLVSARDCMALRPLLDPATERMTRTTFVKKLSGVDLDELATVGRALVEERPLTFAELGKALAERWPDNDGHTMSQVVRWLVPLVQVPPRGLWGRSGPIAHTSAESWLGDCAEPPMTAEEMIRRYLRAFGPASVKDVQIWSGLTRLAEVFKGMDLVRYRAEDDRVLYDLPDMTLPPAEISVPVRFMYDFDNAFIGYADRTRFITPAAFEVAPAFVKANVQWRLILVDGFTAGDWTVSGGKGTSTLTIHQWKPFAPADLREAEEEGARLLEFLAPGERHEIATVLGASRP
ncbi:winged helix DNA-binding domain-containing protein [Nonomuraea sp. NPDC050790]|uniref:winged helix DNA-binding domain-containing protein n=1 Tax=Nonomuraea sp. NPDC050790 TaxID=3364371 RepID=UPI0037A89A19